MYLVTAVFLHPRAVGLGAAELLTRSGARRVVVLTAPTSTTRSTSSRPGSPTTATRRRRRPCGDVAKVLGRARTFAEWVTDHAALFDRTPA